MQLIITTNRGIRLLDTESWEENVLIDGQGSFYGLSWDQDYIYAVKNFNAKNAKIYVLNNRFDVVDTLNMGDHLLKPHQISINDNKLWVANTGKNALTSYDLTTGDVVDHTLPDTGGSFWEVGGENHFNSLTFKNNLIYVCAHNGSTPSTILILDRNLQEVRRLNMGRKSHNVAFYKGITICNSGSGSIECDNRRYYKTNGLTRGLAQTHDEIIFGVSTCTIRRKRPGGTTGGKIGFIRNGSVDMIPLENCSQIYEVRILDKFDYGHCVKPFI